MTYWVVHAKLMGMYLRTTKRKNRDGGEVVYYQLAHNVRHPKTGNTVAQVIHTFGRADQLKREGLVRLCRSIGWVCGLEVGDGGGEGVSETPREAETTALVEGVVLVGSRRLGLVWVVEALWERLAIGPTVRRVVGDGAEPERALLAMTAHRLCDPRSKRGVWERWRERVYLPGSERLSKEQF